MTSSDRNAALDQVVAAREMRNRRELFRLACILGTVIGLSFICAGLALSEVKWIWARSVGLVGITGLAAGTVGAVLGFLFGIPRVLSDERMEADSATVTGTGVGARRLLGSNSNLEQVSDWLTKIIVGLGLVELHRLNGLLSGFQDLIRNYSGSMDGHTPLVAVIMLVFASTAGFLWMYLETRLVLSLVFGSVEQFLSELIEEKRQLKERAEKLEQATIAVAGAQGAKGGGLADAAGPLQAAATGSDDSELRRLAAAALASSGRTSEAKAMLASSEQGALADITKMQVALYEAPPKGFEKTLSLAAHLSRYPLATERPEYWFYQAAAFGQQFKHVSTKADKASARDNALDCAKRAIAIDPGYKLRIRWLMHPDRSPTPTDNDMSGFAGDPTFETLIGPDTTPEG